MSPPRPARGGRPAHSRRTVSCPGCAYPSHRMQSSVTFPGQAGTLSGHRKVPQSAGPATLREAQPRQLDAHGTGMPASLRTHPSGCFGSFYLGVFNLSPRNLSSPYFIPVTPDLNREDVRTPHVCCRSGDELWPHDPRTARVCGHQLCAGAPTAGGISHEELAGRGGQAQHSSRSSRGRARRHSLQDTSKTCVLPPRLVPRRRSQTGPL